MSCFSVGDRVTAIIDYPDDNHNIVSGDAGTVCAVSGNRVGVRWDNSVEGHNCEGCCENDYGWWVDADALDFDPSVPDEPFDFDEKEFSKLLFT